MPRVLKNAWQPDNRTKVMTQRLADEALAKHNDPEDATAITGLHGLYACQRPVERHLDIKGAEPGMRVHGLVIRSDGHRLHSQRLSVYGCPEGLPLDTGDFYELDPLDPHWTTTPKADTPAQLIFFVEGDMPDGRSRQETARDLADYLADGLYALGLDPDGRI